MARQLPGKPACIPNGRPRGAKALGIRYERLVARHMPWAMHGPWYAFRDAQGESFCQPDLVWHQGDLVVVVEVKHTWVEEAEAKLRLLYLPVVAKATGKRAVGLVICKYLVPGVRAAYGDLQPCLVFAQQSLSRIPTFHWLGKAIIREPFLVTARPRSIVMAELPGGL